MMCEFIGGTKAFKCEDSRARNLLSNYFLSTTVSQSTRRVLCDAAARATAPVYNDVYETVRGVCVGPRAQKSEGDTKTIKYET